MAAVFLHCIEPITAGDVLALVEKFNSRGASHAIVEKHGLSDLKSRKKRMVRANTIVIKVIFENSLSLFFQL